MTMELKITCFAIQSAFRERKRVWVNVLVGHPRVRPLDLGFSVHGSSFKTLLSIHRSCHMTSFTRSRCTSNRGWGNLYVYSLSLSLPPKSPHLMAIQTLLDLTPSNYQSNQYRITYTLSSSHASSDPPLLWQQKEN